MSEGALVAGIVFLGAYLLIAIEKPDRTITAVMAGLLMVALGILDEAEAFGAIDLNVIFLLAGMMVIASVLVRTGFFEWVAIRSVALSRGRPIALLLILSVVTAVLSAFLDNVTTVVLVTPVMLSVSKRLGVSPVPYLVATILSSNIGGTATLIGDPPNIMIGSAAGLGFGAFLANLAPVVVLIMAAFLVLMRVAFRGHLQVPSERRTAALEATEEDAIRDRGLLVRALLVTGATIAGFLAHGALDVEPATVALLGAMAMLLVSGTEPRHALKEIEWNTLFFFIGLFMMVEGLVVTGIIERLARGLIDVTGGQADVATIALLWFSAGLSAIVDNIPYTATAIPVVQAFAASGVNAESLWWALALGACLGGNLTIVGASANVVVSNISRQAGHPITFAMFIRYGSVTVLLSMAISTVYLWVRYLA